MTNAKTLLAVGLIGLSTVVEASKLQKNLESKKENLIKTLDNSSKKVSEENISREEANETNQDEEKILSLLEEKILKKVKEKGQEHHYRWFLKKTKELKQKGDIIGMAMLNKNFDFTEKGGLIINTPQGPLKFAPKQASFDDVKDINGLKEGENFWTENEKSKQKGLWANFEASEKMRKAGKKICSDQQFLEVTNAFPGLDTLYRDKSSTKVKDFFDLLGVNQFGFRRLDGSWSEYSSALWSSSISINKAYFMECDNYDGVLFRFNNHEKCGFGVWFLED